MWPSFNSVTIGTPNDTFIYFSLCLFYAFGIAHITRLGTFVNVVKMESGGMVIETAINTSVLDFVGIYPPSNTSSSDISYFVRSLSIFWITESYFPKFRGSGVVSSFALSVQ